MRKTTSLIVFVRWVSNFFGKNAIGYMSLLFSQKNCPNAQQVLHFHHWARLWAISGQSLKEHIYVVPPARLARDAAITVSPCIWVHAANIERQGISCHSTLVLHVLDPVKPLYAEHEILEVLFHANYGRMSN